MLRDGRASFQFTEMDTHRILCSACSIPSRPSNLTPAVLVTHCPTSSRRLTPPHSQFWHCYAGRKAHLPTTRTPTVSSQTNSSTRNRHIVPREARKSTGRASYMRNRNTSTAVRCYGDLAHLTARLTAFSSLLSAALVVQHHLHPELRRQNQATATALM